MNEVDINVKEYAIGGKLIAVSCVLSDSNMLDSGYADAIKMRIANDMARYMIENNLIEFTKLNDVHSFNTVVRARAYLAPNDQVKIIRTLLK